jgi:DNA-binding NarL/FixJ family response regulator
MVVGQDREPRVVLLDSHPMVLLSAGTVLAGEGIDVVAATASLELAVRLAGSGRANVLVMDLWRLDGSPRAMIADLRRRLPHTAIVILTMETEGAYVSTAVGAGAHAYVSKDRAELDLAPAVRAAANGRRFISEVAKPSASRAA